MVKSIRVVLFLILLGYITIGCAPPATYVIDLVYTPLLGEKIPTTSIQDIRVAVIPFVDGRTDKRLIGTRTRIFGKVDQFEARPAPATTAVTQVVVSALKIRGFQTEVLPEGTDPGTIGKSPPHIILSGRIEELRADARSKPGYTGIKTFVRLRVRIDKVDKAESTTVNIQSQSDSWVIFFNPSIMQKAINETLADAIDRLLVSQGKVK